jgi:hypothetical protein
MSASEISNWSDEETEEPLIADHRNFYKVEKWSKDGQRVIEMVFAGSSLDKAKRIFDRMVKHRPRIRLTIRQRSRVLQATSTAMKSPSLAAGVRASASQRERATFQQLAQPPSATLNFGSVGVAQLLHPLPSAGICGWAGVSGCSTAQLLQPPPPSAKPVRSGLQTL